MEKNLISFLPTIEKNEKIILLRAFLFFFFVLASWYALRPVRNELAVQGGIYNLPWLLMGVMLAMLIINPIGDKDLATVNAVGDLNIKPMILLIPIARKIANDNQAVGTWINIILNEIP